MFYDKVSALCKQRGIRVSNLCDKMRISRGNITRWKNGSTPSADRLSRIADYFRVPVDYLLEPPEDSFADIGDAIKEERQYQSLSRKALADEIGITDRALSQYEENMKDVPKSILIKISDAFGMHWAAFLDKYNRYYDEIPDGFDSPEEYELTKERSDIAEQKEQKQRREIGFDDFTYAMYNESQELTEADKQKLLEMARFFKAQQDKEKDKK